MRPALPWLMIFTLMQLTALTPTGAETDAPAPTPAAVPSPVEAPPTPGFLDPTASPLLDHHYQTGVPSQPPPLPPLPAREVFARRFEIVHAAGVTPGMRIAAIGVGDGHVAALFARAVGAEGVVYGMDSAPERIAGLAAVAKKYRVANLVPLTDTGDGAGLAKAGIDLAFIGGGDDPLAHPQALLEAIHAALVPYGTLIIVAAQPAAGPRPPRDGPLAGTGRDALITAVRQAGFRLVDEPGFLRENDFLRFERIGEDPPPEAGAVVGLPYRAASPPAADPATAAPPNGLRNVRPVDDAGTPR